MNFWLAIGFLGQILFGMRFVIQWVCSERRKESYIPLVFWYFSILGGITLLIYSIYRKDPVFILGQAMGLMVYVRNIVLISQKQNALGGMKNEIL